MGQFQAPLRPAREFDVEFFEPDEDNKARAIRQCLRYLQWEAHTSGLDFLAQVIDVAALAAEDAEREPG